MPWLSLSLSLSFFILVELRCTNETPFSAHQSYVELIKCMGGLWLERNISVFLNHVLDLVANPRATSTHVDAVYARKCILFIMRSVIGGMLGEKAQISAAKEICHIIIKQMNTVGESAEIGGAFPI